MATEYQIVIRDILGNQVGILTGQDATLHSLSATRQVNAIGTAVIEVEGSYFQSVPVSRDYQIQILRRDLANGIDWYTEWVGLICKVRRSTDVPGNKTAILTAKTYNWLLRRRWIEYYTGTPFATKSGPGETVIKAYVDENAGAGASSASRLADDGPLTGLTVESDFARGTTWTGDRAQRRLLDTITEIAAACGLYFDIEVTKDSYSDMTFKVFFGQRGTDRSVNSLVPVIFSTDHGNMVSPFYEVDYSDSINLVTALGQGPRAAKPTKKRRKNKKPVIEDILSTAFGISTTSFWNDTELMIQVPGQASTLDDLDNAALGALMAYRPKETFGFTVLQQPSSLYGKHYFFGDLVTARYEEIETNLMLSQVKIGFAPGQQETLGFVFQDVNGDV